MIQSVTVSETRMATRWPTIAYYPVGRRCGDFCSIPTGYSRIFTVGTLMMLVTIPVTLAIYLWQLMPFVCRRYRLTNRRVLILKGYTALEDTSIGLDQFDTIDVEIFPGDGWLQAGDLVFRSENKEVFRLPGVSRPETFRQTCLKAKEAATIST